jgi:predicted acetyltransferase
MSSETSSTTPLRLRPLTVDDEAAFLAGHRVMEDDNFTFALAYEDSMSWTDYLELLETRHCSIEVTVEAVPSTLLAADVAGTIVGRVSIRHALNEWLAHEGGHIGFGVLPPYRRRGYATEILRQSLPVARALGVGRVLVTCDDDNLGSAAAIERCGGVLESKVGSSHGTLVRRYWIDE